MEKSRFDRIFDYFPILAFAGFWLQGAFIGALVTGDPRLIKLGFVTFPAIIAMLLAVFRIRAKHREHAESQG